ncbi:MAG: hypothetical protein IJZ47_11030 [Oscillospiraceae bacterium]|nr:hypothetical protein [Oscillospiraceae bacterium]
MVTYKDTNFKKALSALYNQQKAYLSGCCRSNNSLATAEQAINGIMLKKLEELAVEDIMNGGEHDIKNISNDPACPILVIDSIIFCNYRAAKKFDLLQTLGCPLDGTYSSTEDGEALLQMINDLQTLSLADHAKKYYVEGEYFNGSARLISMLEKIYDSNAFSESAVSVTEIDGDIRFDNRAKVAVMQFINANTNNQGRYENAALYYGNREIKTVGAELSLRRADSSEDFVLSKLTLQLFVDDQCSEHFPFAIALGANEREAARSFGKLFTSVTYPRFADNASERKTAVLHIPDGTIRDKACGGPNDKRTLTEAMNAYEYIHRKTSTPQFVSAVMNHELNDEDRKLATELLEYDEFFDKWRDALDLVQYSTLTVAVPNSNTDSYKVISLFKTKEEYIRCFTMLTGGFSSRIRPLLLNDHQYPEKITEHISFHDLQVLSGATIMRFRDEVNAIVGNRRDLCDVITVAELDQIIRDIRSAHANLFKDGNIPENAFNALFAAERKGDAYTLLEHYNEYYFEIVNEPVNDMHRFALSIGNYLYSNATLTVGSHDILLPAGITDYWLDEREGIHEIYIDMPTKATYNKVTMKFKDGKLIGCSNDIYVSPSEQYSYAITNKEELERYIPYSEIRSAVGKYLLS